MPPLNRDDDHSAPSMVPVSAEAAKPPARRAGLGRFYTRAAMEGWFAGQGRSFERWAAAHPEEAKRLV